jgi:hypothetical protein
MFGVGELYKRFVIYVAHEIVEERGRAVHLYRLPICSCTL